MKRLVKIIRDENGDVSEYQIKQLTNAETKPRGGEYLLLDSDESIKYPKIEIDQDGNPSIVEDTVKKESEEGIALRVKRMDFGKRLIAIMSIRNDTKSWDASDVAQFASDYSSINTALLNGSIGTAKALIDAIAPDGTITTQADKDAMLAEINSNLGALGYE